jgi:FtsP/CotA-like multicopper oxidase with cupredoxin domain
MSSGWRSAAFLCIVTWGLLTLGGCEHGNDDPGIDDVQVIASSNGLLETTLVVMQSNNQFGAVMANTATYDGRIPGPVLRIKPGDTVRVHLVNQLSPSVEGPVHDLNTTNLHFHGLHVPPTGAADNVFVEVHPGETFDYEFQVPLDHTGGFFWYHPHHHGNVSHQVGGGMTGGIVIEGALDQVPEVAAARERFLILNELKLDAAGHAPPAHAGMTTTSTLLVTGFLMPTIDIRPGEVQRWRIVAANGDRFFLLTLDGHQMHQIAKDGFPFASPVAASEILVLPGERIEVLVQGGAPGLYAFKALEYDRGGINPPVPEVVLASVLITGEPVFDQLPAVLTPPPPPAQGPAAQQRFFDFDQIAPHPNAVFTVSGQPFDPNNILASPVLGTTEEWLITDIMGEQHPFHLHTHPFQVLEVNGNVIANPIWQDTALIPAQGFIIIRIPFLDFAGKAVFHCHILEHEDLGMMAAYETVP